MHYIFAWGLLKAHLVGKLTCQLRHDGPHTVITLKFGHDWFINIAMHCQLCFSCYRLVLTTALVLIRKLMNSAWQCITISITVPCTDRWIRRRSERIEEHNSKTLCFCVSVCVLITQSDGWDWSSLTRIVDPWFTSLSSSWIWVWLYETTQTAWLLLLGQAPKLQCSVYRNCGTPCRWTGAYTLNK